MVAPTSPPDQFDRSITEGLTPKLSLAVCVAFKKHLTVVVVIVIVIVVVVPTPTPTPAPAPRSRGNFHIKIPRRSRLEYPRCRENQSLPRCPVGSSLATIIQLQDEGVRLLS